MKIVLDTNVLISALVAKGVCANLLEHCVSTHEIATSDFILGELRRHLTGKFKVLPAVADETIELLTLQMEVVVPEPLPQAICRDADDDQVLGTAVAAKADCIVTGDKDLLVLESYEGIEIVSPGDFTEFEANGDSKES